MKNKKNKIAKYLVIIIIFVGVIGFYMIYNNKNNYSEKTHLEKVDSVVNDVFLSKKSTYNQIKSVLDQKVFPRDFYAIGKDSFIRRVPDINVNLNSYKKIQDEYATAVEDEFLNNVKYESYEDDEGNIHVKINSWYFSSYINDMGIMIYELLKDNGVSGDLLKKDSEKYNLYEYKAKVLSMKILDQYLDEYSNKDETKKLILYFDENNRIKENEYFSLYFNLIGVTSKKSKEATEKYEDKEERIKKYIDDAVASGYISKEDIKNISR